MGGPEGSDVTSCPPSAEEYLKGVFQVEWPNRSSHPVACPYASLPPLGRRWAGGNTFPGSCGKQRSATPV